MFYLNNHNHGFQVTLNTVFYFDCQRKLYAMLFLRFPNPERELITNFYNKKPKDNYFLFHYHYESYSPNKINQLPQDYLVQQSCFLCWCLFLKALFFYSELLLKIFDVVCHFMKPPEEVILKSWNQEATMNP